MEYVFGLFGVAIIGMIGLMEASLGLVVSRKLLTNFFSTMKQVSKCVCLVVFKSPHYGLRILHNPFG